MTISNQEAQKTGENPEVSMLELTKKVWNFIMELPKDGVSLICSIFNKAYEDNKDKKSFWLNSPVNKQ